MNKIFPVLAPGVVIAFIVVMTFALPASAEILNNDEYGSMEIIDISVIENAADMFSPIGLTFNVSRGGMLYPGEEITIRYQGQHDRWVSILDFSPDRIVKPLVMNNQTRLTDGGLERMYYGTVGDAIGKEYVLMVVSSLPLTDSQLEDIALAPDEIELDDLILSVSVNDFTVRAVEGNPNRVIDWAESLDGPPVGEFIELAEFAEFLDYPLNTYPYNPWQYMYLYPYARFRPTVYMEQYGPFSKNWYVIPVGNTFQNNFWDYTTTGWIDNGIWVIPPGGHWQGTFYADDPYLDYYLRVLPYLVRENTSYMNLMVEINGTLVQSSIDFTAAIGWGEYWTSDPFAYYSLERLLRQGDNVIRIYWPSDQEEDLELQMLDMVPIEEAEVEGGEVPGTGIGEPVVSD